MPIKTGGKKKLRKNASPELNNFFLHDYSWSVKNLSASMAAIQPVPAAVTA